MKLHLFITGIKCKSLTVLVHFRRALTLSSEYTISYLLYIEFQRLSPTHRINELKMTKNRIKSQKLFSVI